MKTETVSKEPIAIIGLGCVLPEAPDVPTFWTNLLEGRDSVREVDPQRWDPALYWNPDKEAPDMTYAKIGAWVHDDGFDSLTFRMPPKVVEQIDPSQRWALAATRQAFLDAGYATGLKGDEGKPFDRERCAVILGNAMGGETNKAFAKRMFWPEARAAIANDPDFQGLAEPMRTEILTRAEQRYKAGVPSITEDTMPGHLSNVVAGRVANVFDLSGKNFTTDAACASSLAALDAAVDALRGDETDLVVWGGSDRSMDITPYIEFSKIGALSPDGSRPFDKGANGFVMGEGCAVFLLKRLADAERDGDKVYAVVRGIGSSSDGKGKGITAPNPIGQVKAVRRAYTDAAIDPFTIGYLEAHGTSTPVGDPVELESVNEAFGALSDTRPAAGSIAVGSVKSNIGHLKAAAGAAGALKAVLALHHGRIPASINVQELNPRIDWNKSVFKVQTQSREWPQPADVPRRAAVSSFGFGGTNFHIVLEQHVPGRLRKADAPPTAKAKTPSPPSAAVDQAALREHMVDRAGLEAEPLVLARGDVAAATSLAQPSFPGDPDGTRLRTLLHPLTRAGVAADERVAFHVSDIADIPKRLALAEKAMADPATARLAFNQGVFLGRGPRRGKVAFLFPGQGTQYVNMGRDLAEKFAVVRNTFEEADEILFDELDGVRLTDILWPTPDTEENRAASEERLRLTEFTQPAVLAMDIAMLRLLKQWRVEPDMVAGHSLGEYGALVAAGVLSFQDALHAVAARGREMAGVQLEDLGKMASVSADWHVVDATLRDVDGYVICANKNCPSQTVIAGSTDGVAAAVERLKQQGIATQYLPVSAAFHSKIVAPASEPLRRMLGRLDVQPPRVTLVSNVGAAILPDDPEAIRDNLAVQVASPVDWVGTIQRMYDDGVRTFIEVGPKRALTGFVADILKDASDMQAMFANHPKKGGIQSLNELYAFLGASGLQPRVPGLDDAAVYTATFRDPVAAFMHDAPTPDPASASDTPSRGRLDAIEARLAGLDASLEALRRGETGQPVVAAPTPAASGDSASTQPAPETSRPTSSAAPAAPDNGLQERLDALGINLDDIGIAGISVGLPGTHKPLFDDGDWDRILAGENLIDALPATEQDKMVSKNIVRLVKGAGGQGTFQAIEDVAQVIKLAGRRGEFDLAAWGVGDELSNVLDKTSQYALAAGLEALHDAGIPLQRTYVTTSTGGTLPKEWKLPEPLRDETGIVFASAFPGYDALIGEISRSLADRYAGRTMDDLEALYGDLTAAIEDPDLRERVQGLLDREFQQVQGRLMHDGDARYAFNRKFLFHVLSLGHAQLAQFLGARGPNTQLNAACASTTQAIAVAEDWIRTGRARRVLVVGADDATSDNLFEWIGSGFLASGAATTNKDIEEAALPFDARRHGMIVGMGAVGLVVEAVPETEKRGMRPIARLLATEVANSAYHGSRLDVDHIAQCMRNVVEKGLRAKAVASGEGLGLTVDAIAASTLFMSHETYTPARGGSAAAEIHALRATFGDAANRVVVANTKGFTGHPQGAGIEDAVVLKCLQRGQVPPIPNLKQPDPELGDLNLSKGGSFDVRYALRLAAGFGSQVAMTFTELVAREDERVADVARHDAWLEQVSGIPGAKTEVVHRTLRIVDAGAPPRAEPEPVPQEEAPVVAAAADADVLTHVIAVVAEKTGYPADMLEPDLDLEADLGIDTVKQAELFGELRTTFGVELDEQLQLKDYNTLRKVADYMGGGAAPAAPVPAPETAARQPPDAAPDAAAPSTPPDAGAPSPQADAANGALDHVIAVVAEKTGYPADMLEPDLDLEADLGIDTVKQAELFGELRTTFGVELDEQLQLKDYNTLRKVADYMAGAGSRSEPSASTSESKSELVHEPATTVETPVAAADDAPATNAAETTSPATQASPSEGGPATTDAATTDTDTTDSTPADATPATAEVRRLIPVLRPTPSPDEANELGDGPVLVVGDPDLKHLDAWKAAGFRPTASLREGEVPAGILCLATRPDTTRNVRALFDAAKAHPELAQGFVAVVTAQDGAHGLHDVRDASMAALCGIAKSLGKEWPEALVKCIDLHPADPDAPRRGAEEVRRGGRRTEVAFGRDGTRNTIDVAPAPLGEDMPDVAGKAFVVSGGAQGITAELLARIAAQGPRLLLLGRTSLPEDAVAWSTWDAAAWKAEEQRVIEALRQAGDKVTPVNIQKALEPKRKAAEVQRNITRLMHLGAEVLYAPVDVTDAATLSSVVASGREQFGAIHGVIHAAGVEISKAVPDKPPEQFDMVYSIKHDGLANLLAATAQDDLQWLVAFGSVAARFGNVGQTDYAAANEFLAKEVVRVAKERDIPTAFTVAWGPWGEVGMATRGSIMTVLDQAGVTPIPTEAGAGFFLAEMATPGRRESVVAGALGALDSDHQVVEKAWDPAVQEAQAWLQTAPEAFRLLRSIDQFEAGHRLGATIVLDRAVDMYLDDHAIDDVPLLPGVFGIEAFAQAGRLLAPEDQVFLGARDVRFASPLKQLKRTPVEATVTAQAEAVGDETQIHCRLTSRFIGPDGKQHGDERLHFEGTVLFGPAPEPLRTGDVPICDGSTPRQQIYPPFFHGPSFQVLDQAGPIGTEEAIAVWRAPEAPLFAAGPAQFQSHPLVTEGLFQLCGLRTIQQGAMTLPAGLEQVDIYAGSADEARLWCRFNGRGDDGLRRFDAAACTPDGRILVRLVGFAMVETGPVAVAPAPSRNDAPSSTPSLATFDDVELPAIDGVAFACEPVHEGALPDGLSDEERHTLASFKVPKRAADWLAGRLAVKAAVRSIEPSLDAARIAVRTDDGGAPSLVVDGAPSPARISITHRDGLALAAVADDAIGIDLETIEARGAPFWEQSFGPDEAAHLRSLGDDALAATCAWAAKEACLKRHGTGMGVALHAVSAHLDGSGGAVVTGPFGAWGVRFFDVAGRVLAVSLPSFDATAEPPVAHGAKA